MDGFTLWLAQGGGLGRFPVAPGTVGSLAGLLWLFFLLGTGQLWGFFAGCLAGLAASVWACGRAEYILVRKDPASVVLDEIAALPVAYGPWVVSFWLRHQALPPVEAFFLEWRWVETAFIFALFRVFDIAKPWPVRQSQHLAGGWGITADDLLAALYAALISLVLVI